MHESKPKFGLPARRGIGTTPNLPTKKQVVFKRRFVPPFCFYKGFNISMNTLIFLTFFYKIGTRFE